MCVCVWQGADGAAGELQGEPGSATLDAELSVGLPGVLSPCYSITGNSCLLGELFNSMLSERVRGAGRRSPPELEL